MREFIRLRFFAALRMTNSQDLPDCGAAFQAASFLPSIAGKDACTTIMKLLASYMVFFYIDLNKLPLQSIIFNEGSC